MYLSESDKQKIIEICRRSGVSYCAVFGSYARGEATKASDVDLLVKFSKPIGWAFYGIAEDLETALGRKVDLATDRMIGKYIRESVMRDLQIIYEETEQRRPVAAYS
jgi:predicted nucleotidyltransferase